MRGTIAGLIRRVCVGISNIVYRGVLGFLDWPGSSPCHLLTAPDRCAAKNCSWLKGECVAARNFQYCNQGQRVCAGFVYAVGIYPVAPFPGAPARGCELRGARCEFTTVQLATYRERAGYVQPPWSRDNWSDHRAIDPSSGLEVGESFVLVKGMLPFTKRKCSPFEATRFGSRREDTPNGQYHKNRHYHKNPWQWNMAQRPRPPTPEEWRELARHIQAPLPLRLGQTVPTLITIWRHPGTRQLLKVGTGRRPNCRRLLDDEASRGVGNLILNWRRPRPAQVDVMCIPFATEETNVTAEDRASGLAQDIQTVEWAIRSVLLPANEFIESDFRFRFLYEVNARCHVANDDVAVLTSPLGPKRRWCRVEGGREPKGVTATLRCRGSRGEYNRCRSIHAQRRHLYFSTVHPPPNNTKANKRAFIKYLNTRVVFG